jgi:hypothetical protein
MLTNVMDNAVTIPVIKKRIGLDAMLGLIPYAGVRLMQARPAGLLRHECCNSPEHI